jgi:hypothetical protein
LHTCLLHMRFYAYIFLTHTPKLPYRLPFTKMRFLLLFIVCWLLRFYYLNEIIYLIDSEYCEFTFLDRNCVLRLYIQVCIDGEKFQLWVANVEYYLLFCYLHFVLWNA